MSIVCASSTANCKMGNFFEWNTELPYLDHPRMSPTVVIQNIECNFYFSRDIDKNYFVYLKPVTSSLSLLPFRLVIYCNCHGGDSSYYLRYQVNFLDSEQYLCTFHESMVKMHFTQRHFARFSILFGKGDGLFFPQETETNGKCVQVDLTSPTQTEIDYLSSKFGDLLRSGDHSDVQLHCDGGYIPAHKAILVGRSQGFSDMLQGNATENRNDVLDFAETNVSVMRLCLDYIYEGKVSEIPTEMASDVYDLANELKIPALAKMCAELMINHLSKDNYISFMVLADQHDDKYFKSGLIDYISSHAEFLKD